MGGAKDLLWDAERLAQFSNLAGAAEVEQFKAHNDGFFPRNYQFWNEKGWPAELGPLPTRLAPFWQSFQRSLQRAWRAGFPLEDCVRLIASTTHEPDFGPDSDLLSYPVRPYQRAVMLLGIESWRARFCGLCGSRFVADKPARRFCGNTCSAKARQTSRGVSWRKHGKKWRARYKKRKAKGVPARRTNR